MNWKMDQNVVKPNVRLLLGTAAPSSNTSTVHWFPDQLAGLLDDQPLLCRLPPPAHRRTKVMLIQIANVYAVNPQNRSGLWF
jgi:hypothetical protein